MKYLFIFLALIFLSSCTDRISADKQENNPIRETPTSMSNSVNTNSFQPVEPEKIDQKRRDELDIQNQKFREVPVEFKDVDFENFKFPSVKLKDGEFEEINVDQMNGATYRLGEVFYVDLTGDIKKEAIVILWALSCGGSCDGGSETTYFYSSQNGKAKLLDFIQTGSRSSGCFIKSFAIKNKKLSIEQFGTCIKNSDYDENIVNSCKFCVKDLTRSVYVFNNQSKLVREFVEEIKTPETNVMNYFAEISIE